MVTRYRLFGAVLAGLLTMAVATSGQADDIVLTVSGDIEGDAPISFTDAELAALPVVEFETATIWTDGVHTFSGPSLKSVLEAVGAGSGALELVAANDYKVSLPRDVIEDEYPIIANRINGKAFGIRDKGPLWVIFPYDTEPRFQTELTYAYSIWQLTQLQILPE